MNITNGSEDRPLPLASESEAQIEEDSIPALLYLQETNNLDLAEMLGLEPKGEN